MLPSVEPQPKTLMDKGSKEGFAVSLGLLSELLAL